MRAIQNEYNYRIYDFQGRPIKLESGVKYDLKLKNGYILALREGQRLERIPNLVPDDQRYTA